MLKVHSCKSENLSDDSPTCDILELYSSLVTFYHNVHYREGLEIMEKWNNFPWK